MLEWKKKVWKSFTENCPGHFLLLLDQFTGHMTQEVQDAIAAYRKEILLIPTGYTGKLQVLDVVLNLHRLIYLAIYDLIHNISSINYMTH